MRGLVQDLRYAVRLLARSPVFTAVAVVTLALGIGANTAIFSIVNAVLLRPLPYPDSERLVRINERTETFGDMSVAYPNFLDWREQNESFEYLGASRQEDYNLTGIEQPIRVLAHEVSHDFFPTLRVLPSVGRNFSERDDSPEGDRVAILSHAMWQRQFAASDRLDEMTLLLDDESYSVIGVMPADFRDGPQEVDLWLPLGLRGERFENRGNHPGIYVVARLRDGVSIEQARSDMETVAQRLEEQYPNSNTDVRVNMQPLREAALGDVRPAVLVLWGAVGLVLLIACANVANLLLERSLARRSEIATRAALGAAGGRLIRQMLTETALLAVLGGTAGLALGFWLLDLVRMIVPGSIGWLDISIDPLVLAFTLALTLGTTLLFGLAPAIQSSRAGLSLVLNEGGRRAGGGARQHPARRVLVVAQVGLAVVLLIGSGLMIRSFWHLSNANPGFNPESVLTMEVSLPEKQYAEAGDRALFFERLMERLEVLPGVRYAGASMPLIGGWQRTFFAEGMPLPKAGQAPYAETRRITPEQLQVMGIPLLTGRHFNELDRADSAPVVIVDESFAKRFWPDENAVGNRVKLSSTPDSDAPWMEVIGVAGHVKVDGFDQEARVQLYVPYEQGPLARMRVCLRVDGDPASYESVVRAEAARLDPNLPVYDVRLLESYVADWVAPRRMVLYVLGFFAVTALILAVLGIYGVLSYSVARRTAEIGIRRALGAQDTDVSGMVIRAGTKLVGIGLALGLLGAVSLTWLMSALLYGVKPGDPWTFAGVAVLLAMAAFLATYLPARRAAKVDPMTALRYE